MKMRFYFKSLLILLGLNVAIVSLPDHYQSYETLSYKRSILRCYYSFINFDLHQYFRTLPIIGETYYHYMHPFLLESSIEYYRCKEEEAWFPDQIACPPKPILLKLLHTELVYPYPLVRAHIKFFWFLKFHFWYSDHAIVFAVAANVIFWIALFYHLIRHFRLSTALQFRAPRSPIQRSDAQNTLRAVLNAHPVVPLPGPDHPTLRSIRQLLEQCCLDILFQAFANVRDVGGSITRNANLGSRLHICKPDLTAADLANFQQNPPTNEYCTNLGQNCNQKLRYRAAIFTYTDFYMSTDQLASCITGPSFIITHDFAAITGHFDWFNGEATGVVSDGVVTMTTRGGTEYSHGYHLWRSEGVIIGKRSAVRYYKIADYGNSIVIYAFPVTGVYLPGFPDQLQSSVAPHKSHLSHSDYYERVGDSFKFYRHGHHLADLSAATLSRVAYMMSTITRDSKFPQLMNSTLRTRMAADSQDLQYLPEATLIVSDLCDRQALSLNHRYSSLVNDVIGLSWFQRRRALLGLWLLRVCPTHLLSASKAIFRWFLGTSPKHTLLPFLWEKCAVPNYETLTAFQNNLNPIRVRVNMPFPAAGLSGGATANPASHLPSGPDAQQSGLVCQSSGDQSDVPPTPAHSQPATTTVYAHSSASCRDTQQHSHPPKISDKARPKLSSQQSPRMAQMGGRAWPHRRHRAHKPAPIQPVGPTIPNVTPPTTH